MKRPMVYHIGLVHGGTMRGGDPERVTVQMRRDVDFLDCEIWEYLGMREVTKTHVRTNRLQLLSALNKQYGTNFTKITVD